MKSPRKPDPFDALRHRAQLSLPAVGGGAGLNLGFVTVLPSGTLINGTTCVYKADVTNGIYWELIYDGLGTLPWKKLGGPPLFSEVMTEQVTSSVAYTTLATAGPSITTPLKGDYDVSIEASMLNESAGTRSIHMSYQLGAAAASDDNAAEGGIESAVRGRTHRAGRRHFELAAGLSLAARYKTSAGTAAFRRRRMWLDPVRVG